MTKAVIDGKAIYVGQSKASVEAALGAPDNVLVFDPAKTAAGQIMREEMQKRGDWHRAITWEYNRGGRRYNIRFDENVESVKLISELSS